MDKYLVELSHLETTKLFEDFFEALANRELEFYASTLERSGYGKPAEIKQAVRKAMVVCNYSGIPLRLHFKRIYLVDQSRNVIKGDWKLSRLGYFLTIINGPVRNPLVARLQVNLVKNLFDVL